MWPAVARKGARTAAWTVGWPVVASPVVGVVKTNKQVVGPYTNHGARRRQGLYPRLGDGGRQRVNDACPASRPERKGRQ